MEEDRHWPAVASHPTAEDGVSREHQVFRLEADHAMQIEPDDFSDADSGLGDEMSIYSSTASLRSSIMRAREENGREYHGYKDGKYVLPVDEEELERQEFQYYLCKYTFDYELSFAPLRKAGRVLDIGCGLGSWVMEFGELHPDSHVIGVDLSPVQPLYVPPNVQFEIDDLEETWTFSMKFDYVHSLMMTGAFRDWPRLHHQAFEHLNPGGYFEIQDVQFPLKCDDGTLRPDSALARWNDLMMEAGTKSGFRLDTCARAPDYMAAAGFVDIVTISFKWPMGGWPKDPKWKHVGRCVLYNFDVGCEAMMLALFTRFMGWTKAEVVDFSRQVRADMKDLSMHGYFDILVTYGRKPPLGLGEGY